MGGSAVIAILVRTDGRDGLLEATLASLTDNVNGPITRRVIHSDHGAGHVSVLSNRYPDWEVIGGSRAGFGGAIERAWAHLSEGTEQFVFDTEDDFIFNRRVRLGDMAAVLTRHPYLAQMALVRDACNADEYRAGGLLQAHPDAFVQVTWNSHRWLEHRAWWTTNPSLIGMDRIRAGWPDVAQSEGIYSHRLFEDPEMFCGYWGGLDQKPAVRHIGAQRVGTNY